MAMACPVMKPLSGAAHQTMAWATSSGVPRRRMGTPRATKASASASVLPSAIRAAMAPFCTMGVRAKAGQMALTRMPRRAFSAAAVLVRPTTPCLAAE